jgi:hypothetical protein
MWVRAPLQYGAVQEIQVEQNTVALEKASRAAGIGERIVETGKASENRRRGSEKGLQAAN